MPLAQPRSSSSTTLSATATANGSDQPQEGPVRSRNARAQARHRAKRKAYIEQVSCCSSAPPGLFHVPHTIGTHPSRICLARGESRKAAGDPRPYSRAGPGAPCHSCHYQQAPRARERKHPTPSRAGPLACIAVTGPPISPPRSRPLVTRLKLGSFPPFDPAAPGSPQPSRPRRCSSLFKKTQGFV